MRKTFAFKKQVGLELKEWGAPNFAVSTDETGGESIHVSELDDDTLFHLADEWLKQLYEKAQRPMPTFSK